MIVVAVADIAVVAVTVLVVVAEYVVVVAAESADSVALFVGAEIDDIVVAAGIVAGAFVGEVGAFVVAVVVVVAAAVAFDFVIAFA